MPGDEGWQGQNGEKRKGSENKDARKYSKVLRRNMRQQRSRKKKNTAERQDLQTVCGGRHARRMNMREESERPSRVGETQSPSNLTRENKDGHFLLLPQICLP